RSDRRRASGHHALRTGWLFTDEHVDAASALALLSSHSKIKVAFSNPSFDFWLYLHYKLYDVPQNGSNREIHRLLARCSGFAEFGDKDKRITGARALELLPRIKTACTNARTLGKLCATDKCAHKRGTKPNCGALDQDPSSGMWRLLESLRVLPLLT
ncbi:RloB domain-containing protein, partial [Sphaerimonospora cavernae]